MEVYRGKCVCGGIAIGRLQVYEKNGCQVRREHILDAEGEVERLKKARRAAIAQLAELQERALESVGAAKAAIFETHQMMLLDDDYIESAENIIRTQQVNAEYAVAVTGDNFAAMFAAMDDAYMKERAADVQDISERVIGLLSGNAWKGMPGGMSGNAWKGMPGGMPGNAWAGGRDILFCEEETGMEEELCEDALPVIVVAQDLTPSETIQIDPAKVLAFVTVQGSSNSHTAILARTMGIPALAAVPIPLEASMDGRLAVVDAETGVVLVDPDPKTLEQMQAKRDAAKAKKELLLALRGKENVTLDGKTVMLSANIGHYKELAQVLANDAEGIGLFRSEFLYLERDTYPTEEEQMKVYRAVAETMAGKPVKIRTMDIGADKQAPYFELPREENPAMGFRAIRLCLNRRELFKTQLRALFRASAFGRIAILYPMITSQKELWQIQEIVAEIKGELTEAGVPFGDPRQGIMIETPAAVMISDQLAREVDFFSIGTNDLTQYTLAVDRQNGQLEDFYDPRHPAVLRMIGMTVENAHREGIPCGICGELAADTELTKLFLSLGVDELSMSPESILPVRQTVRETNVGEEGEAVLKLS